MNQQTQLDADDLIFRANLKYSLCNPQVYHRHFFENMTPALRNHVAVSVKVAGIQASLKEFGEHILIATLLYHPALKHLRHYHPIL